MIDSVQQQHADDENDLSTRTKTNLGLNRSIQLEISKVKKKQSRKKRKENTAPNELRPHPAPTSGKEESYDEFGPNLDVSTVHYLKKCQLLSQDVSYMNMSRKLRNFKSDLTAPCFAEDHQKPDLLENQTISTMLDENEMSWIRDQQFSSRRGNENYSGDNSAKASIITVDGN